MFVTFFLKLYIANTMPKHNNFGQLIYKLKQFHYW